MGNRRTHVVTVMAVMVALTALAWFVVTRQNPRRDRNNSSKPSSSASTSLQVPRNITPVQTSAIARNPGVSNNLPSTITPALALTQLVRWAKNRDGKDIDIVNSQTACDLNGNPISLVVVAAGRQGSPLDEPALRKLLENTILQQDVLRTQLTNAYHAKDIAAVNRLVAERVGIRSDFITTNALVTYKLSLTSNLPPVLSFWEGLPVELVKEQNARNLVTNLLGGNATLKNLVHYDQMTALLCFTNTSGQTAYVDPLAMRIVSPVKQNKPAPTREGMTQADKQARTQRVAAQWHDFLML